MSRSKNDEKCGVKSVPSGAHMPANEACSLLIPNVVWASVGDIAVRKQYLDMKPKADSVGKASTFLNGC
jgi:hypothetical protein